MATFKEAQRKADAYRKDTSPKHLNHERKGKKAPTGMLKSKDHQK